jgi:hypothetical protein
MAERCSGQERERNARILDSYHRHVSSDRLVVHTALGVTIPVFLDHYRCRAARDRIGNVCDTIRCRAAHCDEQIIRLDLSRVISHPGNAHGSGAGRQPGTRDMFT